MVRGRLEVHSLQINKKGKDTQFFCMANDIPLEVKIPNKEIKKMGLPKAKEYANEMMVNAMRFIKHTGDLPRSPDPADLDKWSHGPTGLALKPKHDPINEFPRFL